MKKDTHEFVIVKESQFVTLTLSTSSGQIIKKVKLLPGDEVKIKI